MKQNKIKWIGNILALAAVWFLIDFFRKLQIDFQILCSAKMLAGVCAGTILSFASVLLSAWAWKNTVAFFAEKQITFHAAAKVYMQANLGKYIPGNIMHFVERNMFAAKAGIGQAETTMGTFLEIECQLFAAALFGIIAAFQDVCVMIKTFFSAEYAIGITALFLAGIIVLRILYRKLAWVRIFCKKIKKAAFWRSICLNILLYAASLLLLAILMCLLVGLLNGAAPTFSQAHMIMSVYVLSWTAGFVIPGAPGGIGVREFVMTYLTRNHPMQETILIAVIVHRICTVLGDMFAYLFGTRINA